MQCLNNSPKVNLNGKDNNCHSNSEETAIDVFFFFFLGKVELVTAHGCWFALSSERKEGEVRKGVMEELECWRS